MASEYSISQLIKIGQISQGLANTNNLKNTLFKNQTLDKRWGRTIYEVWKPLSLRYAANPSDTTLRQIGEWLLQLCGPLAFQAEAQLSGISAGLVTISNPANVNINVGQNATFSVTVTSSTPYTIQWFRNNIAIPGATGLSYTLSNAQLTDSGSTFFAVATNASGPIASGVATLTVAAVILLSAFYTDTDPHSALLANSDTFAYQFTVNVTHNQPISIPIPQVASNNKFWVWRVISTEQDDNTWFNSSLNNGTVPDSVFYGIIKFGGNSYYSLRNASSFDYTQPLVLSKV